MFEEIDELLDGKFRPEVMNNLFVITSLIESKSRINKQIDNDKNYNEIVNERRNLVSNIYELYRWISKGRINPKDQEKIHNDIKELIEYKGEDISTKIAIIENGLKENININTKITLSILNDENISPKLGRRQKSPYYYLYSTLYSRSCSGTQDHLPVLLYLDLFGSRASLSLSIEIELI